MDAVLGELPQLIMHIALITGIVVLLVLRIMLPDNPLVVLIFTGSLGYWSATGGIKLNSKIKQQATATGPPEPPIVVENTPHILTRDTTV